MCLHYFIVLAILLSRLYCHRLWKVTIFVPFLIIKTKRFACGNLFQLSIFLVINPNATSITIVVYLKVVLLLPTAFLSLTPCILEFFVALLGVKWLPEMFHVNIVPVKSWASFRSPYRGAGNGNIIHYQSQVTIAIYI